MLTDAPDENTVRHLLENLELKIVLDSPDEDYRLEYFTTSTRDRQAGEPLLTRTYRLHDLKRGGITPEPWDSYDLEKQTAVVTKLIRLSRYRVANIVSGWAIICPACGHAIRGKNWESPPKTCTAVTPRKCPAKIDDTCLVEILSTGSENHV